MYDRCNYITQQMRCGVICAHVGETANFKWPADGTKNLEKAAVKKFMN